MPKLNKRPFIGFGLGLRPEHYDDILAEKAPVDFFEIITENYLIPGGKPLYYLHKIAEQYPIIMHGVSLSIGSADKLDKKYLQAIKNLAAEINPLWISDHLCWTGVDKLNMHDLLPLPYTEEAIQHVVTRIDQVQHFLGRQILIENVSSYVTYQESMMPEWDFIAEIAKRADCYILLDINNIYVSAINHHFDPQLYLQKMPPDRIHQFHLAGHTHKDNYIIDTHDSTIVQPVWDLYADALKKFGYVSTMIERDDNIPNLDDLLSELALAKNIAYNVLETNQCTA